MADFSMCGDFFANSGADSGMDRAEAGAFLDEEKIVLLGAKNRAFCPVLD